MDVTKLFKKGRGRGAGRGTGDGRGRGRGRGRGFIANKAISAFDVDEEDDLCNMALAQAELDNNSIAKAFEELNAASQLEGFDPLSGGLKVIEESDLHDNNYGISQEPINNPPNWSLGYLIAVGGIWIYPTNRPVRDYQYEIVKTALFNNTLVSLPTGLGKTFISAVVMYNFQRWYPTGIIVFMAPTRPLVTQQLDACHNTVGISPAKTVELTGQIAPKKRQQLWQNKTVFFLTPQVFLSDLERKFFSAENVRCIVVDEAHKALGNHAYVHVIEKVSQKNRQFRVLALSATPGSDIVAVQQVFKNLLISRVELRSENSLDILPYVHDKKVEKIVVKLDQYLKDVHDQMLEVFQVYTGKLLKANALTGRDGTSYSKFQLLKCREQFRKDMAPKLPGYQKGYIEVDYAICISLSHAIEILLSHGLRTFYIFLNGVLCKEKGTPAATAELKKNTCLQHLLDEIQRKLNISAENSTFDFDLSTSGLFSTVGSPKPNRLHLQEDTDFTLSHPKLKVLKDIVHKHFLDYQTTNATTRVMIFSQYRDSVQEIGNMLNSLRPMVKPMVFIGQANTSTIGRGLKQKDQVQVVQQFRDGDFNVLVSTSVGEEGLDIGEVDLIICFDASKSPTRLIQRMGRTGRQRDGRTVFLLTQGKEERSYSSSFSLHSNISKSITDPAKLQPFLYKQSPRMVPTGIDPVCYKMSIILSTEQSSQPEPIRIDLSDDNVNEEPSKEVPQKKQANTGKKRTKGTVGTSGKKPTGSEKATSSSIVKLFEKINKAASQNASQQRVAATSTKNDLPIMFENDDGYCYEEGMHMFAGNNINAYNNLVSIFPKIFDIDRPDRLEWRPCTTFVKTEFPSSTDINSSSALKEMDSWLLQDEDMSAIACNLKSRGGFSYLKSDFCGCGNTMEPHDEKSDSKCHNTSLNQQFEDSTVFEQSILPKSVAKRHPSVKESSFKPLFAQASVDEERPVNQESVVNEHLVTKGLVGLDETVTKASSILDQQTMQDSVILHQPFIDEDFNDPHFLDGLEFESLSPSEFTGNVKANTPPPNQLLTNTSPICLTPVNENISDDDIPSEFSASPEVNQNRFLEKLNEIKSSKGVTCSAPGLCGIPEDLVRSDDNEDVGIASLLSVSKKKFKFRKKTLFSDPHQQDYQKEQKTNPSLENQKQEEIFSPVIPEDEKQVLIREMTPSPPLSPILNLQTVINDPYESPTNRYSHADSKHVSNMHVEDGWDDFRENDLSNNAGVTSFTSPPMSNATISSRKPLKFVKSSGEKRTHDTRNELIVKTYSKPTLASTFNIDAANSKVFQNTQLKKSMDCFDTKIEERRRLQKLTSVNTSVQHSIEKRPSTISSAKGQVSNKNRQSLSIVKPNVLKYSSTDFKMVETEAEHRPIVRSYGSQVNVAAASSIELTSKRTGAVNGVGKDQLTNKDIRKYPSTSSVMSSTVSHKATAPPVKNLLSRNRHKKHETSVKTTSLTNTNQSSAIKQKSLSAQLTPPRLFNPDSSDDSPEIIAVGPDVPPYHSPVDASRGRRLFDNLETTPNSPASSLKLGNPNGFRVPNSISTPCSATISHTTPTNSRHSFSRRPLTYTSSPASPALFNVRGATKSPTTPTHSRHSFSRRPLTYTSSPASPALFNVRGATRSPTTPTHSRHSFSRRPLTYTSSPAQPALFNVRGVSHASPSDSPFIAERENPPKQNRRRGKANPYIEAEAVVIGDDSDTTLGDENEFEYEGLDDTDDSFVNDDDDDIGVTDSQQVMYLKSVKDAIPAKFGRIERPLSPRHYEDDMDITGESYEDDSFCQQDDDVEYMDVGVFTQAMNQAKADIAVSNSGRQTRRGKREAMTHKNSESNPRSKQRRRVIEMDDSSDDDDDDFR